jgi:CDP-paratose 2-epimerase
MSTIRPDTTHEQSSRRSVLITGGAGFIGASVALELASRHPGWELTALDNLHRRGSELNLTRLRERGVRFVHGDVREPADIRAAGQFDALVECSAEPSVLAGSRGDSEFVVRTNLLGAYHCLEEVSRNGAQLVFLSTSRVYPVAALNALAYSEGQTRFLLDEEQPFHGASVHGISEDFPLRGARTLYGASKLAAELLVEEYADSHGISAVIDRCGVIAGPWQMGKVDQGVFTHWMLRHYFQQPLRYLGFGATGRQVRDLLHVNDLAELIDDQLSRPAHWSGAVVNVGGGSDVSLSLHETTTLCQEITGNKLEIDADPNTRPGDVPIYLSDCRALNGLTDWRPRSSPSQILHDIYQWIHDNERLVAGVLKGD